MAEIYCRSRLELIEGNPKYIKSTIGCFNKVTGKPIFSVFICREVGLFNMEFTDGTLVEASLVI